MLYKVTSRYTAKNFSQVIMDRKPASRTVMGLLGTRAMGGVRKVPGVWIFSQF